MGIEHIQTTPLALAVRRAGSQSAFARIIGRSQPTVYEWLRGNRPLPAEHVLTVERETGVSKHLLRPDLYPAEPSPTPGDEFSSVAPDAAVADCDRRALSHRVAAA